MSNREFYSARVKAEAPAFSKVIRALPLARGDYRPHPRSRSAAELAWVLAGEVQGAVALVETHRAEWDESTSARGLEGAAEAFEQAQARLLELLAGVDDAAWAKEAQMLMGGQVGWTAPLGEMLWGFLFDAIHHRGQLSTYLRPMGGKVPSIYGPSGDEPMG
ncbi:MAG TPA: DinB family protein [Thermoanaerobaculaceae bacterium]|nr:DinB family protein [Thermoanaerobaculaceae bacterium]HPS79281.1 DinB family protein [Thermoanaerobaculaceae bacterium]